MRSIKQFHFIVSNGPLGLLLNHEEKVMTTGLFEMNRKSATAKPVAEPKACMPSQTGTRKPAAAHKPAVHRDYHIPSLPKTIAEAIKLGWTFELVSDAESKRAVDTVTVKGVSPNGTASKMFHERLINTPFYTARTIVEALTLGWTPELVGDAEDSLRLDFVEVKFTSPFGMVSRTFGMLFGATPFYTGPAVAPATQETPKPQRKSVLTPVEQAQRRNAKVAQDRADRAIRKTTTGSKPQPSSGKKPKGKK